MFVRSSVSSSSSYLLASSLSQQSSHSRCCSTLSRLINQNKNNELTTRVMYTTTNTRIVTCTRTISTFISSSQRKTIGCTSNRRRYPLSTTTTTPLNNVPNNPLTSLGIVVATALSVTTIVSLFGINDNTNKGTNTSSNYTLCDGAVTRNKDDTGTTTVVAAAEGGKDEEEELFYGLFPKRQLYKPTLEYPLWDENWDGLQPESSGNAQVDRLVMRNLRKHGVTKHIILIRHGQYDESSKNDELRVLTPLGIKQAHYTGQRIAQILSSTNTDAIANGFTPCNIRTIRVSCLTRAKQTADIIASYLQTPQPAATTTPTTTAAAATTIAQNVDNNQSPSSTVTVQYLSDGDPNLNEGRPCHTIPPMVGTVHKKLIEITDQQHPRIEQAYKTYFHRLVSTTTSTSIDESSIDSQPSHPTVPFDEKHEFEIIVCHANVIRYFLCRALQLPPEAWLRYCPFNCSLTYLTIRPTGTVSCRMVGDIGHLPYDHCTFSQHHGFNW